MCHLAFGECERSLGVRAHLVFCEETGSSFKFASFSIPSKFFKWENFSKFEKQNFPLTFTYLLNSKHVFFKLRNFSFIELPWDRLTDSGLHLTFSYKTHERHLIFYFNMFSHDPIWKYQLVVSCSKFQFLVEIWPSTHEIGCWSRMSSLSVLTSARLIFAWKVMIMYKTSQNSHLIF